MASDVTVVLDAVRDLDREGITRAVAAVWEAMGWETRVMGARTDVDGTVIAQRPAPDHEKQLIQARPYASGTTLDARDVRECADLSRHVPDADTVVLVTAGRVSAQAREVARDMHVKLVDADEFARLYYAYVWDPSDDEAADDQRAPPAGQGTERRSAPSSRQRVPGSRIGAVAGILDALVLGAVLAGSGVKRLGNGSMTEGLLRLLLVGGIGYLVLRVAPGVVNVPGVPFPFVVT